MAHRPVHRRPVRGGPRAVADIVGFTARSSRTSPEALVTMPDEPSSTFDRLAEPHGLEKIETIGSAA